MSEDRVEIMIAHLVTVRRQADAARQAVKAVGADEADRARRERHVADLEKGVAEIEAKIVVLGGTVPDARARKPPSRAR